MKVKELIALLQQVPEESTLYVETSDRDHTCSEVCSEIDIELIQKISSRHDRKMGEVLIHINL